VIPTTLVRTSPGGVVRVLRMRDVSFLFSPDELTRLERGESVFALGCLWRRGTDEDGPPERPDELGLI